jgi:DNA-binding LytR/AlgR family response regulator
MKINCLLVDDEPLALEVLQSHISNTTGLVVTAICKNAIEALDVLNEKQIDLIFLDIKMPKLAGTDFLKSLTNPPKIIFVTAYREYALDSYDLDAVDYLVKPVTFERFLKAVFKVKRLMGYEVTTVNPDYKKNPDAFVYLRVNKSMQKVFLNQIVYIESWKDYVKVYLSNGSHFLAKQSISAIENMLSEHSFLRVHRSFMISLDKLTGYNNNMVIIAGQEIPIGRFYKQQVMETIATKQISS